jgi:glycosyltransferase involved in cell wall biosynthesis
MDPERVFVVRSGPSLERLKIQPPDEGLKQGRRHLVGYVGVMGRQEGIDLLLHAARVVVHCYAREDVHFGLVGGGTSLEELRELAQELGIAGCVTFTGRVPDAELLAMLNTADVCVNPDRACALNDKSTMNKVMEYMALGKPVVQFDLTEGRRSAGDASLYAQPDDAVDLAAKIVELLDDPQRREFMGRVGRARIERSLEWRHQAPRLLAAYAALGRGAPRPQVARGART